MSTQTYGEQQSPTRYQLKTQLCELFFEIRQKLDEVNIINNLQNIKSESALQKASIQQKNYFNRNHSIKINKFLNVTNFIVHAIQNLGSSIYLRRVIPLDDDQNAIYNTQYTIILQYIKQILNYLIVTKNEMEQLIEQKSQNECSDYESCLQKLEAEVRQHIRVEQQLKLYAETTQEKLEQVMKEKEEFEEKYKGVNIDQLKQIEKNHLGMVEQMKRKEDDLSLANIQLKQKIEQNEQKDELILQLQSQIQQLQISQQQLLTNNQLTNSQYLQQQVSQILQNPQTLTIDSSQTSKMVSVNPHSLSSQQNLNENSYIEGKRGKRSVSSMNEETIKKYTQFSQSSQINPQQILSSNTQITYNPQNKNQNSHMNNDQIIDQQNTRLYTEPHIQERSSSRLGNTQEMKENRKSFDKYAQQIQEKLMKKDAQNNQNYNESQNKSQQQNNQMNAKINSILNVGQNVRNQVVSQKQSQIQTISQGNTNNSSQIISNSKQKTLQHQVVIPQPQQQGYLQTNGINQQSQIHQSQLYPTLLLQNQNAQQQSFASGSRVRNQQTSQQTSLNQPSNLPQTNNGSNLGYQFDGGYQNLESQRNKQTLSSKLNDIQNCLSSRQTNTNTQSKQGSSQNFSTSSHFRNNSNQSVLNANDKSNGNIMNNSYTLQHYQQQQQNYQQIPSQQINLSNVQLNSSNIKYSPLPHQGSYSNNQTLQQNSELNKSQRSFMNVSQNNINVSMNQYNSREQQNNSHMNINNTGVNGSTNASNHVSGSFKNNQSTDSQANNNQFNGSSKYGQYIQQQRPNSSLEKSNPYIQNRQQHYKQQSGNIQATNNQNVPAQNNQLLSYSQIANQNCRSQSMDGFSKQQPIPNKQGSTNQGQNTYLKQKTASQMQTAEVINNLIKNFKMN